jgi:hypothetical protein
LAEVTPGGSGRLDIDRLLACERLARPECDFATPLDARYLRLELLGPCGQRAWSQPFMVEAHRA